MCGALKHIHKLQVLQNKTVRKITNANYSDPGKPIYNELGISTALDNLYKTELCKLPGVNSCIFLTLTKRYQNPFDHYTHPIQKYTIITQDINAMHISRADDHN